MHSVRLSNVNGNFKIVSESVILESSDSTGGDYTDSSGSLTFKERVQDNYCIFAPSSQDICGCQWNERQSVPLYSDSSFNNAVGIAYFIDESVGISYGDASNRQIILETCTFVINNGSFGANNTSTMIQYNLAQAGSSVYFTAGQSYKLKLTSNFDSSFATVDPTFSYIRVDAGSDDKLRTLTLPSAYGNFKNTVNGQIQYYWNRDDFNNSNDYGYANNHSNYYAESSIINPPA
jgi:hypothetical protein